MRAEVVLDLEDRFLRCILWVAAIGFAPLFTLVTGGVAKRSRCLLSTLAHREHRAERPRVGLEFLLFRIAQGDRRVGHLSKRAAQLAADFGRRLDYYTGFVFEIYDPARREIGQVVGGGRYDNLLSRLGAGAEIPAVGCAIWIDRLTGEEAQ